MTMSPQIRQATGEDIGVLVETIRRSFKNVADRFGLTRENAPRHPSNCRADWIQRDMERGVIYFIIEEGSSVAGCVALEQADSAVCYLERLAVLPGRRQRGFGDLLVAHVISEAGRLGAHRVDIGIIAEHDELKRWYKAIGFVEVEKREFPHLPFSVTFMSYGLDENCRR